MIKTKKFIIILFLGFFLSTSANGLKHADSYVMGLKCLTKNMNIQLRNFDAIRQAYGENDEVRYFHIRKHKYKSIWTVHSNWDEREHTFKNYHIGYHFSNRLITFGALPGDRSEGNSYMQINRGTGEMRHLSGTDETPTGWFSSFCTKIEFENLPRIDFIEKF